MLEEKLNSISPDIIVQPESYIAVPVLQAISYCVDNEELRNMYANLLASSMILNVKNKVHPSYVEIIKQLSPDEAKILAFLYKTKLEPVIYLMNKQSNPVMNESLMEVYSLIAEKANCEVVSNIQEYFENLERLNLIDDCPDNLVNITNAYDDLMRHPLVIERMSRRLSDYDMIKAFTVLTKYGYSFCEVCLKNTK